MTKRSALGSAFFVGTRDISGDVGALTGLELMQNVQDVSSIEQQGTERIGLRRDGRIGYAAFWNPAANRAVDELSDLGGPVQCTYVGPGTGLGRFAASLIANKSQFQAAVGQDGSLGVTGEALARGGFALEWGRLLTLGKETSSATEVVAAWQATHDYALNDLVQPTTPNGHYYKATADAGSSDSVEPTWPTNGTTVVDDGITWTDQGLLPNGLDRGVGSASNFGLAAYLHVFSIGSGTANLKLQDSADRIAWDDVPGAAFTAVTGATTQRVATSATENVRRYLRLFRSGSFTNLVAAVNAVVWRQ